MARRLRWLTHAVVTAGVLALAATGAMPAAAQPTDVEVALIVPLSGPWARQGLLERMGAEMAIDDINKAGGIKALGGAKMKLVIADAGDSAEKAKNAAQRLVAQAQELVQGVKPQDLRDNDGLRRLVASEMAGVQTSVERMIVDAPRRRIIRPQVNGEGGNHAAAG